MQVDITLALHDAVWTAQLPDIRQFVKDRAHYVLTHQQMLIDARLQDGPIELAIVLTNAREVQTLNKRFRAKDKPTNVLSFPADVDAILPQGQPHILGDIVLAYEIIRDEAKEQGKAFDAHLTHIITHGILHCLGYDHMFDEQADIMENTERSILTYFNISDPYSLPAHH